MHTNRSSSNAHACGAQVATKTSWVEVSTTPQYQQIKLALDVHAASIVVARMVEGAKPQPSQTFQVADFLAWARKQKALAQEVASCYEAGPTGFWLHRQLTTLGIRNYVVCSRCLDEGHGGVNTDWTDALELATRLDRYLAGNDGALAVVRVPTEAEEQKRAHKRQRQQLREQRLSLAAQGRSLMLLQGRRQSNHWWREHRWESMQPILPRWPVERLQVFRELILKVDEAVRQLTREMETQAPKVLPKGMGRLTYQAVETEVAAWDRFRNRRQVGSYAGLCGGVSASGQSSTDLSLTKAGSRRAKLGTWE